MVRLNDYTNMSCTSPKEKKYHRRLLLSSVFVRNSLVVVLIGYVTLALFGNSMWWGATNETSTSRRNRFHWY